jgi:predicted permease
MMVGTLLALLPVIIGIAAGFALRRLGMVDHRDGDAVFKLVLFVFLPALMFTSLATVDLDRRIAVFPAAAAAVIVAGYLAGRLLAARTASGPAQGAVLVSGCMLVNSGFALPFVQALYGPEGAARIAAFDSVNTTVAFTWAYYTAARSNPRHRGASLPLDRLVRNPALYAITAGLVVNLAGVELADAVAEPLVRLGSATAVLIPLGVGILFDPVGAALGRAGLVRAGLVVAARLATGLAVATALVLLLDLSSMDRTILLLLAVAPLAFVTVTFASLENLDVRLATSALSLSLVTGLVLSLLVTLLLG